ncbi:hypothetical protein ACLK16_21040 [Escherichia coli]
MLIETLPAVFEMDELLYQMKDHIVALNCGRWDYIFSYIKTLKIYLAECCPTVRWSPWTNPSSQPIHGC